MTHRLMSALMIVSGAAAAITAQLNVFPEQWRPWITMGAVVAIALSQSAQAVVKGQGQ